MRAQFQLVALMMVLAGCAKGVGANEPTHGVIMADEKMVADCRFVTDVSGVSPWYGVFAQPGLSGARNEAIKQAVMANASHVVWTQQNVTYGSTAVHGRAYRCP
jgi:hypothetical protein